MSSERTTLKKNSLCLSRKRASIYMHIYIYIHTYTDILHVYRYIASIDLTISALLAFRVTA